MEEVEKLVAENPEASAMYAVSELHEGRLEWLAQHIVACNFQIDPMVARKLLSLIEGSDQECFYQLQLVRRSGLPPAAKNKNHLEWRHLGWAVEVARLGGFQRGHMHRASFQVAERHGVKPAYLESKVSELREQALAIVEEESLARAYANGEIDFLGRPISG